ncbi:MAG: hypothetical protein ABI779_24035 [Acidobacteriota bacterium]
MLRKVVALAILTTALRFWLAIHYFGFQTGDDAEIVQEAFRSAFGLDYAPWAIRNLLLSEIFVAPVLKIASFAGVHDPFALAQVARWPFLLFGGLNVLLVFLVGRAWFSEQAGFLASGLYSIHWLPLAFGSSLYPRIPGTTFILLATLLVTRGRFMTAGLVAALAFAMRYSEIVFLAPLVFEAGRRWWRLLMGYAIGVLLFLGIYESMSWGTPFSSLRAFTRYTLLERQSSSRLGTETQPWWWYAGALPQWLAPALWPFLWASRRSITARFAVYVLLPMIELSVIHHKELRYLQAVIPFAMIFAAHGALVMWERGPRSLVVTLLVLAAPLQLARIGSVAKRTMPAMMAARVMRDRGVTGVALSQSWAYGGTLFLPHPYELGLPPDSARLRDLAPRVDCVAVFHSLLTSEIRTIVAGAGLIEEKRLTSEPARAVDLFCRPVSGGRSSAAHLDQ